MKEWLAGLRDKRAKAQILNRINRLRMGNFGDCRSVGRGVYELRAHAGPGYRVYFGFLGAAVVILLCGGAKGTQSHDIETAQRYWKEVKHDAPGKL